MSNPQVSGASFSRSGGPRPLSLGARVPIYYTARAYTRSGLVETSCLGLQLINQGNTNAYVLGDVLLAPGAALTFSNDIGGHIFRGIEVIIEQTAAPGELGDANPRVVALRTLIADPQPRPS